MCHVHRFHANLMYVRSEKQLIKSTVHVIFNKSPSSMRGPLDTTVCCQCPSLTNLTGLCADTA
jgi:hypothetical protein